MRRNRYMETKPLISPFKVGDQVIWDQTITLQNGRFGPAKIVEITAESTTRYRAGNLEFDKQTYGDPRGRGKTRGSIRAITPEWMKEVERTIREDQDALQAKDSAKLCRESEEAEYRAWLETPEGQVMNALQENWIGGQIIVQDFSRSSNRQMEVQLIGRVGADDRILDSIRIVQSAEWDYAAESGREIWTKPEIRMDSSGINPIQLHRRMEMLQKTSQIADAWNADAGKEVNK